MMRVRAVASAVLAVALPGAAFAQVVRHEPVTMRSGPALRRASVPTQQRKFRPLRIGPHTFYGTIAGMNGNTIVVRTRHQRMVSVDATTVLAAGTYSAPLFIGKPVTVDGDEAANGVFSAAHISRMTNLEALPNDH